MEERGAAAGCCAALFPSRSSDSDCIICGVIKKSGLDLGGMLSWRLHSGLQTLLFPFFIPPLLHKMETARPAGVATVAKQLNAKF